MCAIRFHINQVAFELHVYLFFPLDVPRRSPSGDAVISGTYKKGQICNQFFFFFLFFVLVFFFSLRRRLCSDLGHTHRFLAIRTMHRHSRHSYPLCDVIACWFTDLSSRRMPEKYSKLYRFSIIQTELVTARSRWWVEGNVCITLATRHYAHQLWVTIIIYTLPNRRSLRNCAVRSQVPDYIRRLIIIESFTNNSHWLDHTQLYRNDWHGFGDSCNMRVNIDQFKTPHGSGMRPYDAESFPPKHDRYRHYLRSGSNISLDANFRHNLCKRTIVVIQTDTRLFE